MKKFLVLQWILLIVGISILTFCEFDCELPQSFLDKLCIRLHVNAQKIQIKSHCITFSDFSYKNFSCKCLKISWKLLFKEFQCFIEKGCLSWNDEIFYGINGHLYGYFGKVCGFLELKNDTVKHIQILCSDFVKTSDLLKKLHQTSNTKLPYLEHLNLKIISLPRKSIKLYGEGKNLQTGDINIQAFRFYGPLNKNDNLTLWANEIRAEKAYFSNIFLKAKLNKDDFLHWKSIHFLGDLTINNFQDFSLFLKFKDFVLRKNNFMELAGISPDISFVGKGTLNPITRDFKLFSCKGSTSLSPDEITKNYSNPYKITLDKNLFFSLYGNLDAFGTVAYTRNFLINNEKFSAAQLYFYYKKQQNFLGHVQFYGNDKWLNCHVDHKIEVGKGFLRINACLDPKLTYPLREFLPNWWQAFFKNFEFYENFPQTNFIVYWNKNSQENFLYGKVSANNFKYKTSELKHLDLMFGYQPGYCLLDIKSLKTEEGEGYCKIHWPYNYSKEHEEFWKFKGAGRFNVSTWQNLINNVIEKSYCNDIANLFQENSSIQADFNGKLYPTTNLQEEVLHFTVNIPQTILYHFPIRNLSFHYHWNPQQFSIENIQGILEKTSPFEGHYTCKQKQFDCALKADHLQTDILLQHPLLTNWSNAIPGKNRSNYIGLLNLDLEATGVLEKPLKISGKGWTQFDNPQLSQIHLLGPLQNLFSKRLKWKPTIEFDQLISDFTFTEKQILSQNTILSGPSTRANVTGELNLDNSELNAQVHFSFLDYQQLKLPIMKQIFQLFQPISKGFKASVKGTFENPQWTLTFNPFRFVLPQKTLCEKRKKLALQKKAKSVD